MTIKLSDLHEKIAAAGIPIQGVALDRPGKPGISIDFKDEATTEQRAAAEEIVRTYDQDAVDAAKEKPVTIDDIHNAKTIPDLKAILIKLQQAKE